MASDDYISDEEREYFRNQMSDVKPLKKQRNKKTTSEFLERIKPAQVKTQNTFTIKPFRIRSQLSETAPPARIHHKTVSGDDILSYYQDGIQHKVRKQFRQGKLHPEATLDLHSHTADQAIDATHHFLSEARQFGYRVVCIIHGKGKGSTQAPVIKNVLYNYLKHQQFVLGFHSAQPKDGGTGALYVLLKR